MKRQLLLLGWLHVALATSLTASPDDDDLQADLNLKSDVIRKSSIQEPPSVPNQDPEVFKFGSFYDGVSGALEQALGQSTPRFADFDFSSDHLNLRPIIGILAQEPGRLMRGAMEEKGWSNVTSYIAASYVKSFQSAGAQVVPIMINKEPEYYQMMARSLNGIVFPGGGAAITKRSGYGRAGAQLYELVMAANRGGNHLPLWTTCLGFEMLMHLASGVQSNRTGHVLSRCSASNVKDPLTFRPEAKDSQMFGKMPLRLLAALETQNVTSNFHKFCVFEETFERLGLNNEYLLLSTTPDIHGVEYISTVEHKHFPIFGTQWHPEKPAYEWRDGLPGIPKTPEALQVNARLMDMYMDRVRRNNNTFIPTGAESPFLISNYATFPVQQLYRSSFMEVYFFSEADHQQV